MRRNGVHQCEKGWVWFWGLGLVEKGRCWPFAAIRNIKNGINPMAASERKAVIGQTLISLAWMTAGREADVQQHF
jgi:hypothetical protein